MPICRRNASSSPSPPPFFSAQSTSAVDCGMAARTDHRTIEFGFRIVPIPVSAWEGFPNCACLKETDHVLRNSSTTFPLHDLFNISQICRVCVCVWSVQISVQRPVQRPVPLERPWALFQVRDFVRSQSCEVLEGGSRSSACIQNKWALNRGSRRFLPRAH